MTNILDNILSTILMRLLKDFQDFIDKYREHSMWTHEKCRICESWTDPGNLASSLLILWAASHKTFTVQN